MNSLCFLSGRRGHGRCRCGCRLRKWSVGPCAVAPWSAPAGRWRLLPVSAGKPRPVNLFLDAGGHLSFTLTLVVSELQVWQRPLQVRGPSRSVGAEPHSAAGGASPQVQGSERRPWFSHAEAAQHQGSLLDLWTQRQRSVPPCCWSCSGRKDAIVVRCHGYHQLDRTRFVFCISLFF